MTRATIRQALNYRRPGTMRELLWPGNVKPCTWEAPVGAAAIDLVVVMAVGPSMQEEAVDTLDSVFTYLSDIELRVVIVDDCTSDGTYRTLAAIADERVTLLRNDSPQRLHRLTSTLARAYNHALDRWAFDVVLRLDVDALITGPGLASAARQYANAHPSVGMFGHRVPSLPEHRGAIQRQVGRVGRLWYRDLLREATDNGWDVGESIFGGACFFSYACLADMRSRGCLSIPVHSEAYHVVEDVYYSMCTKAVGHELGGLDNAGLALAWRDLPAPRN